jgi:uncharacterized Ntn-hydrolase superfamily protein
MRRVLLILALMVASAGPAMATFSIVAIDPATGDLGVAVASRYFAVGAVVPWAEANVGAVATQANVNVGYGPRALELLRQGLTAQQVMDKLFAEDTFPGKDGRQIAIADSKGNIVVFTGDGAQDWKGHQKGATWSAQGNILVGPHVVEAMGKAFQSTNDELAEKLYAALKAGDEAGGDSRGRQSASILVVRKNGGRNTNNDRYVYINVDDHPEPMRELRRLLDIQMTGNHQTLMNRALADNRFADALKSAEHLVRYSPLTAHRSIAHDPRIRRLSCGPAGSCDCSIQTGARIDPPEPVQADLGKPVQQACIPKGHRGQGFRQQGNRQLTRGKPDL